MPTSGDFIQCKHLLPFLLPAEIKARNESRCFVMHAICVVHIFFFLKYMKCVFFRYYICVFDIKFFTLNEDLLICRQLTPVASNTDASKITAMVASQLAHDVIMASR